MIYSHGLIKSCGYTNICNNNTFVIGYEDFIGILYCYITEGMDGKYEKQN